MKKVKIIFSLLCLLLIYSAIGTSNKVEAKYVLSKKASIPFNTSNYYFEVTAENTEIVSLPAIVNITVKNNDGTNFTDLDLEYAISHAQSDSIDVTIDKTSDILTGGSKQEKTYQVTFDKKESVDTFPINDKITFNFNAKTPYSELKNIDFNFNVSKPENELEPIIEEIQITNKSASTINIKTIAKRAEEYIYYIKLLEEPEVSYIEKGTNTTGEYTFTDLKGDTEYSIKVIAKNANGEDSQQITGKTNFAIYYIDSQHNPPQHTIFYNYITSYYNSSKELVLNSSSVTNYGYVGFDSKVDFTDYSKVTIKYKVLTPFTSMNGTTMSATVSLAERQDVNNFGTVASAVLHQFTYWASAENKDMVSTTTYKTTTIDVSNITGEYYIILSLNRGGGAIAIQSITIE